jgi:hypothetical protein
LDPLAKQYRILSEALRHFLMGAPTSAAASPQLRLRSTSVCSPLTHRRSDRAPRRGVRARGFITLSGVWPGRSIGHSGLAARTIRSSAQARWHRPVGRCLVVGEDADDP